MKRIHDDIEFQNQELRRIVARLADQDNRCTSEPLYIVEVCQLKCGLESGFGEIVAFAQDGSLVSSDHWELLEKAHEKYCAEKYLCDAPNSMIEIDGEEYDIDEDHDCGLKRTECIEQWEARAWFLTEEAAQQYIDSQSHNLRGHKPPRIYVESMNRGVEMIALRAALPRLVAMLDENAALRAQVEELRADRDRWQASYNALEDRNRDAVDAAESRATRAEAERDHVINSVKHALNGPWEPGGDTLSHVVEAGESLQYIGRLVGDWNFFSELPGKVAVIKRERDEAKAELATCAKDRDEWMRECVKAQGQRDEARGKCERLERLLKAERALSEELGVTETWKVLVGAHGHPDHVAMWEEYNAALVECGERA